MVRCLEGAGELAERGRAWLWTCYRETSLN